jgi:hypothetical protein
MTTAVLNNGEGYQPRSNLIGTDGWFNTELFAYLADIANDTVSVVALDPTAIASVRKFWFASSGPLSLYARAMYTDTASITDDNTDVHTWVGPHDYPDATDIIEAPATVLAWTMMAAAGGSGTVHGDLRCTTTTNALTIAGRATTVTCVDRGLVDDMAAALAFIYVFAGQTGSGANYGPPVDDSGVQAAPAPILIPETDYTAAIRAAGNTYTDAAGTWPVVGLYETVDVQ